LKKFKSFINPYLITSAKPARNSRSGSVLRISISAKTARGWWKEPIKFFPILEFIPVLPPTELSTWDKRVVGTWIKLIPLNTIEAENPAMSPTTPPPNAIIRLCLSIPYSNIFSIILFSWSILFVWSPPGTSINLTEVVNFFIDWINFSNALSLLLLIEKKLSWITIIFFL